MRNAFAREIVDVAAEDSRFVLLMGDIGNRLFDPYRARFPDRFFNCGVAEANMMSMAAGMALSGLRPFVYTITPFVTTRCLEQIRVDVCYHKAPVVIVGVGAGLCYTNNGPTHQACEDIAFMRALPEMTVVCPGDAQEVRAAVRAALTWDAPLYLRIGKKGEPVFHAETPPLVIGAPLRVLEGGAVCMLSTGNLLPVAKGSAEILLARGIEARVESFHTIKPLNTSYLAHVFSDFGLVVTLEEHSRLGGLGGAVAEWLSDQPPQRARLYRIGTPDAYFRGAGGHDAARDRLGLSASGVATQIEQALAACDRAEAFVPWK